MKKAAPKAQDTEAKPYEPTPADAKALEAYRAARAKGGPRLIVTANSIKIDHADPVFGHLSLLKAVGSTDSAEKAARQSAGSLAEQGDAKAQSALGFMYTNGEGVQKDYAASAKWYRKAAEQGYARAQSTLGFMYTTGDGVQKDYAEAVQWYRKAAEQGDARAQSALGFMYELGQGVSQDYVLAHMWFNLAAAHSHADLDEYVALDPIEQAKMDAEMRDEVATKMTPEQIAEAQRLAREWKPTK